MTDRLWAKAIGIFYLSLMGFTQKTMNDPWPVPEKFQKMPNPVKADDASIEAGRKLYAQLCQSCHGKKGKGDGPKAELLETSCGDFSGADFQKQTDGSLYYKISEGRKEMPSFKKMIPENNDLWAVVNYLRTLK